MMVKYTAKWGLQIAEMIFQTRSSMDRYKIGSGTLSLIMERYHAGGIPIEELQMMPPKEVELLFYPQKNIKKKDIPLPDFQYYYDRIHAPNSRVNISYCWLDYKEHIVSQENIPGYKEIAENIYENLEVYPVAYVTNQYLSEEDYNTLEFPYNQTAFLDFAVVKNRSSCAGWKEQLQLKIQEVDIGFQYKEIDSRQSMRSDKLQTITPDNFRHLAKDFNVTLSEEFLYEK